jgi:hypothetical protein
VAKDKLERATITISAEDKELALKLGDGNLSRGVRILAERQRGRKLTTAELAALAEALAAAADDVPFGEEVGDD